MKNKTLEKLATALIAIGLFGVMIFAESLEADALTFFATEGVAMACLLSGVYISRKLDNESE